MMKNQTIDDPGKCCILVFTKYPKPGMVKTRLAEAIGFEKAAQFYTCMVFDTIEFVKQTRLPYTILFWPGEFELQVRERFGNEHSYAPQKGNDLSQRLINAFEMAFMQQYEYAVAIGSDSPDMPPGAIVKAFMMLKSDDAVIGPTDDGGYYLIGFSKSSFDPKIFKDILWSTSEVLSQTDRHLRQNSQKVSLLGSWFDIDTIEDLRGFAQRNRSDSCTANNTFSYIMRELPSWRTSRE